jgi:hypothetical protein
MVNAGGQARASDLRRLVRAKEAEIVTLDRLAEAVRDRLISAEIGHAYVMGASTVLVALAGVGSFLAAVVVGVFIVVGRRGNAPPVPPRARRFLKWLREEN